MQPNLFDSNGDVPAEIVSCPICVRQKHCGNRAELGPPVDHGECVNRSIRCLTCGATGEQSTNKENAAKAKEKRGTGQPAQ